MQLLTKFSIGSLVLKNRVCLAPMTRARCTPTEDPLSGTPNDLMVEYYAQRASGGLLVTEGTAFSEAGSGWRNAPRIETLEHVEAWKKVTDKVHEKDGAIFLQLWHIGRQAHPSFHPTTHQTFSASAIPMGVGNKVTTATGERVDPVIPTPLSLEQIQETIQDFANGAKLAKEAGFDGVELHGANGYLLDNFFQSCSNQRDDDYGGSFDNRVRLLKETFEAIVESDAFPADRIGFRISPNSPLVGMGSPDNYDAFIHYAKVMNEYKPAYLHIVDGLGFGFHNLCPPVTVADIRKVFDGPIMANGGLTKDIAEGMIRSGAVDLVSFGRPYITNPDLVERFTNGWPLAPEAPYEHLWAPIGAKGYTDYPTYQAAGATASG